MSTLESMATKQPLVMGLPSTMNDDYQLNLRKLFERGCRIQPDNEIITRTDIGYHRITYRQLQARSTRLASAMSKAGINPGDRVASFMWNNTRHFMLYYALPAMGAVLQPMNIRLHPNELSYIIQHSQSRMIFGMLSSLKILKSFKTSKICTDSEYVFLHEISVEKCSPYF